MLSQVSEGKFGESFGEWQKSYVWFQISYFFSIWTAEDFLKKRLLELLNVSNCFFHLWYKVFDNAGSKLLKQQNDHVNTKYKEIYTNVF